MTQRAPGRPKRYPTLFARLYANCEVDEFTGCWDWVGYKDRLGYPKCTMRNNSGQPSAFYAHRLMLEVMHGYYFPFDEAGHLCNNPSCISPHHLEIQTSAHNLSERRNYMPCKPGARWIPVLFPIPDWTPHPYLEQLLAPVPVGKCPF